MLDRQTLSAIPPTLPFGRVVGLLAVEAKQNQG